MYRVQSESGPNERQRRRTGQGKERKGEGGRGQSAERVPPREQGTRTVNSTLKLIRNHRIVNN